MARPQLHGRVRRSSDGRSATAARPVRVPEQPLRPLLRSPPVRGCASGVLSAAIACGALLAAFPTHADSCSVSAATLAFGNYNTINLLDGTTTITITCTHTNSPAVRFDYV